MAKLISKSPLLTSKYSQGAKKLCERFPTELFSKLFEFNFPESDKAIVLFLKAFFKNQYQKNRCRISNHSQQGVGKIIPQHK